MLRNQAEHNQKRQEHFQLHDSVQMSALKSKCQIKGHMDPQHTKKG